MRLLCIRYKEVQIMQTRCADAPVYEPRYFDDFENSLIVIGIIELETISIYFYQHCILDILCTMLDLYYVIIDWARNTIILILLSISQISYSLLRLQFL